MSRSPLDGGKPWSVSGRYTTSARFPSSRRRCRDRLRRITSPRGDLSPVELGETRNPRSSLSRPGIPGRACRDPESPPVEPVETQNPAGRACRDPLSIARSESTGGMTHVLSGYNPKHVSDPDTSCRSRDRDGPERPLTRTSVDRSVHTWSSWISGCRRVPEAGLLRPAEVVTAERSERRPGGSAHDHDPRRRCLVPRPPTFARCAPPGRASPRSPRSPYDPV